MRQTFIADIEFDDRYRIFCDYVGKPDCYCEKEVLLLKGQKANIGDTVFFRCLHYWYKGIVAKGFVCEIVEDNRVNVEFNVTINPKEKPLLSLAELEEILPDKNWKDRYSHILLNADEALKLSDKWESFLERNNIYRGEKMTYKAEKMYCAADDMFEEYGDGSLEVDMLFNYKDLLKFCDDILLDSFDVSYNTEVELFPEEECSPDEKPYMYDDPEIIWTPKNNSPYGRLMITCRGYEFDNGTIIGCGVNENNEVPAQECVKLLINMGIQQNDNQT